MHARAALVLLLLVGCDAASIVDVEGDDAFECRDRADNDGDGAFDCDDPGCSGSPDCAPAGADDDDAPLSPDSDRIFADLEYLASDALEGRAAGSPGNVAATEYVADHFSSLGLLPGGDGGDWLREFGFSRWEPTAQPGLSIDGAAWSAEEDFSLFRGSGGGDVDADVVFVGYGLTVPPFDPLDHPDCPLPSAGFDEYADVDVAGRIVLVLRHGPRGDEAVHAGCPSSGDPSDGGDPEAHEVLWRFTYKMGNAVAHGAAAMIMVPGYDMAADDAFGGALGDRAWEPDFPSLYLDRDKLEGDLPDLRAWADAVDATQTPGSRETGLSASIRADTRIVETTSQDVVGAVEGGDLDRRGEVVLVGAHIDHLGLDGDGPEVFNGADDNASGTAVLMELARLLADREEAPARTVVFAAFNAEELGLLGSCDYASDPSVAYPLADLSAMISVDMVGGGDASGVNVYGGLGGPGEAIWSGLRAARTAAGLDLTITAQESRGRSDHACFEREGVPAALVSTLGEHPHYHQISDESDAISRDDLQAAADLLWAWLQAAADAP